MQGRPARAKPHACNHDDRIKHARRTRSHRNRRHAPLAHPQRPDAVPPSAAGKPLIAGLRWLLLAAERVAFRLTPQHQAETLPPIFLHWAGRHVRPLFERFGANSLEDMYFTEIVRWQAQRPGRGCAIASLGAGCCDMGIALAGLAGNRH